MKLRALNLYHWRAFSLISGRDLQSLRRNDLRGVSTKSPFHSTRPELADKSYRRRLQKFSLAFYLSLNLL
jgi:hypothetical protein